MAGLSAATAIIALIQVSTKLISICWQYRGVKGAAQAAKRLIDQLEGLKALLVKVDELLDDEKPPGLSRRRTLSAWATPERLGPFREASKRLVQQLQPNDGFKAAKHVLLFPLRQRDLENTLGEMERMKSSLNLALTVDQSAQLGIIDTGVLNVRHEQKVVRDEQRAHSIQKWLAAPNVAANQMQKQSERQSDTVIWLLRLPRFEQWLLGQNSLLWLHGIPGSGKSVLCSTVHQHAHEIAAVGIDKIAVYFYFDVSEESKRSTDSMLRSLISQLAHHKMHNKILNHVYDGCQDQRQAVTASQLLTVLLGLIDDYLDVGITIDAIDEAANVQDSMQEYRATGNATVVLLYR